MPVQDVGCQKCGCSNKLGTIYCRNCGTKLKFDKKLLDTHKSHAIKKILKRAFKALAIIAVLAMIGAAFCPWGFPKVPIITDKEEISAVITTCNEMDESLTKEISKASYEFTPTELTLAANYLTLEHEIKAEGSQAAVTFGSGSSLGGGTDSLGGASVSSQVDMSSPNKAEPEKTRYVDPETARLQAWRRRKNEDAANSGKPVLSPHFDFTITIKDEKTLRIVLKERWLKFIPARLEVCVVPKLIINEEKNTQELVYEITSAHFGHLPIPLYLKDNVITLLEEMLEQERVWARKYFKNVKNIEITNGNINVTFGK